MRNELNCLWISREVENVNIWIQGKGLFFSETSLDVLELTIIAFVIDSNNDQKCTLALEIRNKRYAREIEII